MTKQQNREPGDLVIINDEEIRLLHPSTPGQPEGSWVGVYDSGKGVVINFDGTVSTVKVDRPIKETKPGKCSLPWLKDPKYRCERVAIAHVEINGETIEVCRGHVTSLVGSGEKSIDEFVVFPGKKLPVIEVATDVAND